MEFTKVDKFLRDHMHIVRRFSHPTKFSYEPYSTQWHVTRGHEPVICYIQISKDEEKPRWVRLGYLLEKVMLEKVEDIAFIEECIDKYLNEEEI